VCVYTYHSDPSVLPLPFTCSLFPQQLTLLYLPCKTICYVEYNWPVVDELNIAVLIFAWYQLVINLCVCGVCVHSAWCSNLGSAEVRNPRPPHVKFRVGQVVRHKRFGYRGVIIGWDAVAKVTRCTLVVFLKTGYAGYWVVVLWLFCSDVRPVFVTFFRWVTYQETS